MHVDPPLNLSGLMRTFEVARDDVAVLDDCNGFQVAPGPGDIVGVDYPVAGDVIRRLSLYRLLRMHYRGGVEKYHSGTSDGSTQSDGHKVRSIFHGSFSWCASEIGLFSGDPVGSRVVILNRSCGGRRIRPQIFLVDRALPAKDKCHDPGILIFDRAGDDCESARHPSIHHEALRATL